MKEQVTDISKVLQDMTVEMRLMRETINQQYAEIAKLNRNIESLNRQLHKRDKEIIELKARLSKYENPEKDSSNSSTPPSKERMKAEIVRRTSNPQPIGFRGILLVKRQKFILLYIFLA